MTTRNIKMKMGEELRVTCGKASRPRSSMKSALQEQQMEAAKMMSAEKVMGESSDSSKYDLSSSSSDSDLDEMRDFKGPRGRFTKRRSAAYPIVAVAATKGKGGSKKTRRKTRRKTKRRRRRRSRKKIRKRSRRAGNRTYSSGEEMKAVQSLNTMGPFKKKLYLAKQKYFSGPLNKPIKKALLKSKQRKDIEKYKKASHKAMEHSKMVESKKGGKRKTRRRRRRK
jgi:hypothetical protein